jgi:hypothetical protein
MASNLSAQTRGLSAADWTRLQRLRGARSYLQNAQSNIDINAPTIPQTPYNPSLLIPRHTGVSRIQRPTSDWISFVGSQTSDFVTQQGAVADDNTLLNGKLLTLTRLCNCGTSLLETKVVKCKKCSVYVDKTIL